MLEESDGKIAVATDEWLFRGALKRMDDDREGMLVRTWNQRQDPLLEQAKSYLTRVMETFSYVGVLTIEFFEIHGQLWVNEMAPRVHNSGHWTIEGATISQFENHLRAIVGWELGDTTSWGHSALWNLIGELPAPSTVLQAKGFHWHDYQKNARKGRKLGHVTAVFPSITERNASVDVEFSASAL